MEFGGLTLRETTFSAIDRRRNCSSEMDRRFVVVVERRAIEDARNFEARRGTPVGAPMELVGTTSGGGGSPALPRS